ncbi:PadR family transcriptional regulator [Ornithinibacillus salinisoli]|uniref:PadR family transcriptional regulator n=1 Tax=Ornithinibacillus salinisoli TaxID=1848459 RepID=A0ABW4VV27_9BACI
MGDSFIKLKDSMKETVFKDLSFSDERKNAVKEVIRNKHSLHQLHFWKEETLITVLESIRNGEKHGFDISTYLFHKSELSFQNKEGQLYTLLHLLENKEVLTSKWIEGKKYYSLTKKGKKLLVASKQGRMKQHTPLQSLLEEASL